MSEYYLILPSMGESITEATIIRWLKNEGDFIKEDDIILDIATDKIDSSVPSPINGILKKKLFNPEEIAKIGTPIAIIEIIKDIKILLYSTMKMMKLLKWIGCVNLYLII